MRSFFAVLCLTLAGCLSAFEPYEFNPKPVVEPVHVDADEIAERVKQIFETRCVACHKAGTKPFGDILEVENLLAPTAPGNLPWVNTENPRESPVYKAVNTGRMPIGGPKLPDEEISAIETWISVGAPALPTGSVEPPPAEPVTYGQEVECMVREKAKYTAFEQETRRWAVLSVYYNMGNAALLKKAQFGVAKALNGLALNQHNLELGKTLTLIECGGAEGVILGWNLEDLGHDAHTWANAVKDYPYFIDYDDDDLFFHYELELARATKTNPFSKKTGPAYIRGDWLVNYFFQPPLYYEIQKLPKTQKELEFNYLGIDTAKQIFVTEEARAALFRRSGVTNFNRIVHKYEHDIWVGGSRRTGAFWKTFDTNGDKIQGKECRNLFACPFGPIYSWYAIGTGFEFLLDKVFTFDANESIWIGDNGQLKYFLADGKGNRIDEALTEIAVHKNNVSTSDGFHFIGSKPGTVVNGVSCAACHQAMNTFHDEGIFHFTHSTDFSNAQIDFAKQLFYRNQAEINTDLEETTAAYVAAMQSTGFQQTAYSDLQEPIFAIARYYNKDVSVCEFAAELGLKCSDVVDKLRHSPELALALGFSEIEQGKASRQNIEYFFPQIAKEFNLGVALKFNGGGHVDPPPPVKCKLSVANKSKGQVRYLLKFSNESSWTEYSSSVGDTRSWDQELAATLYVQSWTGYIQNRTYSLEKCNSFYFQHDGNTMKLYQSR